MSNFYASIQLKAGQNATVIAKKLRAGFFTYAKVPMAMAIVFDIARGNARIPVRDQWELRSLTEDLKKEEIKFDITLSKLAKDDIINAEIENEKRVQADLRLQAAIRWRDSLPPDQMAHYELLMYHSVPS